MIVRPASAPCFILGVLGGVVVHDDMDSQPLRDLTIDALVAFADDKLRSDIERGKNRGRTTPRLAARAPTAAR